MKICVSILALVVITGTLAKAQNPASVPKDTTLSLPEKNFEILGKLSRIIKPFLNSGASIGRPLTGNIVRR